MPDTSLRWAILGTGVIALEMAAAFARKGRRLYGIGNRTPAKAEAFGRQYGVEKVYADFHEMFCDPDVDIIYLTTPHNTHIEFLRQALSAGKHVLCEKSITLNWAELEEAVALAEQSGVVLAEAMTIYHMPLYRSLQKRVASGEFGKVQLMQLNFGSFKDYDMQNRFFNPALAGGALLDIGVYALSLARLFFASNPDKMVSLMRTAPSGVDEQSGIVLQNKEGQMAVLSLSLHSKQPKRAVISCEKAYLEIEEYPRAQSATVVWAETGAHETIKEGQTELALCYELEDMEAAVHGKRNEMLLPFTIDVMRLMTELRHDWGLRYAGED